MSDECESTQEVVLRYLRREPVHVDHGTSSPIAGRGLDESRHPWFMTQGKGAKRNLRIIGAEQTERREMETLRTGPRSARLVPPDKRRNCAKLLAR